MITISEQKETNYQDFYLVKVKTTNELTKEHEDVDFRIDSNLKQLVDSVVGRALISLTNELSGINQPILVYTDIFPKPAYDNAQFNYPHWPVDSQGTPYYVEDVYLYLVNGLTSQPQRVNYTIDDDYHVDRILESLTNYKRDLPYLMERLNKESTKK